MLTELAISTAMVLGTILFHGIGLLGLGQLMRLDSHRAYSFGPLSLKGLGVTTTVWAYAMLYHLTGAVPGVREAVYFSTITYGAIGYGDGDIADAWKLLAGIEGINGVLLIGWSVAFFVTVMDQLMQKPQD